MQDTFPRLCEVHVRATALLVRVACAVIESGVRGLNWRTVVLGVLALLALGGAWLPASTAAADNATPTPTATGAGASPTRAAATATASSPAATPTAATPTPAAAGSQTSQSDDPFRDREDRMALMLGRARVAAGLLPLARSAELDRAAMLHAQDMVARGYMDHDAPDGSTPESRAANQGYQTPPGGAWLVVETISAETDEPDGAFGYWLSDALHHRVVMHAYWRELGIGFAPGGPYGRFWVALFGCRPNVLPPVLLDGMLAIPTEACGTAPGDIGPVQSVRVAETSAAAQSQDWSDYTAQQPWPAGHSAVVDMRDATGQQLEARAVDPTGAQTQAP